MNLDQNISATAASGELILQHITWLMNLEQNISAPPTLPHLGKGNGSFFTTPYLLFFNSCMFAEGTIGPRETWLLGFSKMASAMASKDSNGDGFILVEDASAVLDSYDLVSE